MGRTSDARERLMAAVTDLIWQGSYGSTTIDLICRKAKVRRGSFYYFFPSKSVLAVAALERAWGAKRAEYDLLFAPHVAPLERLRQFAALTLRHQIELREQCGHVVGCPLFSLGSEISAEEPLLCQKVLEIMEHHRSYLESAIRDGHAAGLLHAPDAAQRSRELWAVTEGLITQARIANDLAILERTWPVMQALLQLDAEPRGALRPASKRVAKPRTRRTARRNSSR